MKKSLKKLDVTCVVVRVSILFLLFTVSSQFFSAGAVAQEKRYYNYGFNSEPSWLQTGSAHVVQPVVQPVVQQKVRSVNSAEKVISSGTKKTGTTQAETRKTGAVQAGAVQTGTVQHEITRIGAQPKESSIKSAPSKVASKKIQPKVLSREETLEQIKAICAEEKEKVVKPTNSDLNDLRKSIQKVAGILNQRLSGSSKRQDAALQKETLKLTEFGKLLAVKDGFDSECISDTFQIFQDKPEMFKDDIFAPLKEVMRQYLVVEMAVKDDKFNENFVTFCDGFPKIVESYITAEKPEYVVPTAAAMAWLTDLGTKVESAKRIADFSQGALGQPNFFAYISADFIASGFEREISEPVNVNEVILGTLVRGSGTVTGKSSAVLTPNDTRAEIRILLDMNLNTCTVGVNGPVTITNQNSGLLRSTKSIYITADKIYTALASTRADIVSRTVGLCIDGGPIIRKIATKKVQQKKPAAEAEARRRAETKFSKRFDNEVNPKIAELNGRFQDEFRNPLMEDGYFPEILDFRTTAEELIATALLAPATHPASWSAPPAVERGGKDVLVELHQSLPNNLAKLELSGRRIEEGKMIAELKEKYPKLTENLNRDEEQPELAVTFAKKSPLTLSFADDVAALNLHFDKLEQEGQSYPGLDITVKYRIRSEDTEENGEKCTKLVFELVDTPSVFPPGFDPNSGKTLSGREQLIRNIVMRRMEKSLKKSFEMKPLELQGQWEGRGKLYPSFGTAENGWLILGWTWK